MLCFSSRHRTYKLHTKFDSCCFASLYSDAYDIFNTTVLCFLQEKSFLDVALEEDFQKTHICKVTLAKQIFFKVETALIAQKRSELLAVFDNG